jgi:uncharacterized BrkB/YihY/UPF0761 family membrane protein
MAPVTQQPYGAASYPQQPGPAKRKTWDVVLTVILLVVGLLGMLFGVSYGILFTDADLIDQAFQQQGLPGFSGDVSHVVLYLLGLAVAIPLLIRRKVAFWAPLTAGVIAAVVFWVTVFAVIASDPTLMQGTLPS